MEIDKLEIVYIFIKLVYLFIKLIYLMYWYISVP